ncbi:MAG: hypothetical protein ACYC7E_06995 [Armatimonadota bacterium]
MSDNSSTTIAEDPPVEEVLPAEEEEDDYCSDPSCPVCGALTCKSIAPRDTLVTFQPDRQCVSCGAIWRPACPRWGANFFVIIGVLFLFLAAYLCFMLTRNDSWTHEVVIVGAFISIFGIACLAYGIQVLRGKTGQEMILVDDSAPAEETASDPVTE